MKTILQAAIMGALLLTAQAAVLPETAMAQDAATQAYAIPAGELDSALRQYATQNSLQLVYAAELVAGKRSPGLSGSYTQRDALQRLLAGTGLEARQINARTIGLRASEAPPSPRAEEPADETGTETDAGSAPLMLSSTTVTGTRIRGGSTPSPVVTIDAQQIQEEGFSDLGQVIRSLPQNFSGGQNPGVVTAVGSGNITNQNVTGGSSLNLRGLGADATLTLLNGRRLAYGGFAQAVDISAIPVEAVDRIEIVADGASAIYGSDAVAGVGNVILKRDFDGIAVGARYGAATDGGLTTREYNATAGTAWYGGGLIATYKDVDVDPIRAAQREYTEYMDVPTVLHPGSGLRSGLISAYQSLGERVEVRLDAFRTEREQKSWYQHYSGFYYDNTGENTTSLVAPSVEISLPGGWSLSFGGSLGKDDYVSQSLVVTPSTGASTLASHSCFCNESRAYEAGVEGPLFRVGSGDARLAVGAGYRTIDFLNHNLRSGVQEGGDESSRFAYSELNVPLVAPDSNIAGIRLLTLTAAARGEDYDSFGSVTTPKIGLVYGPSADFTLSTSWGKSFKAPMLSQRYGGLYTYLVPAAMIGGIGYPSDASVLLSMGSNPDLDPERARTLTASLSYHPEALPGLEAELTLFDVEYTNRVIQPLRAASVILSDAALGEFIDYWPTPDEQAELIAKYSDGFYNQTGSNYDPGNVVALAHGQYTNVMGQQIKGVDLSGSYRFDLGSSELLIRGSASWLDISQRNSAGQESYELSGTLFYPAKINGRIGAVWTEGGFSVSGFANYVDGVTDRFEGGRTSSFTTLDATLRWAVGERASAWPRLSFSIAAQNLLDRAPPLHTPFALTDVPYDSTNYSGIGRFLSASVSGQW